jgi:hypothetical protein
MRAPLLLVGGLALLLGACSGKGAPGKGAGSAPLPLKKELMAGKWKNISDTSLISEVEFGANNTLKTRVQGMKEPIEGRYTWSGEREITVEYRADDVQKAYEAAVKAYKEDLKERVKNKKLYERAALSLSSTVPDHWPAHEKFGVAITEEPRLILTNEEGGQKTFEKAE